MSSFSIPGSEVSTDELEAELNNLLAESGERGDNNIIADSSRMEMDDSKTEIDDILSRLAAQSLDGELVISFFVELLYCPLH
jgi:hypothetical protein